MVKPWGGGKSSDSYGLQRLREKSGTERPTLGAGGKEMPTEMGAGGKEKKPMSKPFDRGIELDGLESPETETTNVDESHES